MTIPCTVFGEEGKLLHFSHANGYPPCSYSIFLKQFTPKYQVIAPWLRPLWSEDAPQTVSDWRVFRDDLLSFLNQGEDQITWPSPGGSKVLGVGHSVGATATLLAALRHPELFRALVLIEPILFLPRINILWKIVTMLGLSYHVHPLIRGALKRRRHFLNKEAMYENYRSKAVFRRISDRGLREYVNALARDDARGGVTLAYPPAWEARIYATAGLYDHQIWRFAPKLKLPVLLIRGAETDAFGGQVAQRLLARLPRAELRTIPKTGHLAPLEAPESVFQVISHFLRVVDV